MPIWRLWLAIAWMMLIVASLSNANHPDLRRRNKQVSQDYHDETIESLFGGTAPKAIGNSEKSVSRRNGAHEIVRTKSRMKDMERNMHKKRSLSEISGPEIFQDMDNLIDSDSLKPHIRVKRKTDFSNGLSNKKFFRSVQNSSPSNVGRHRAPQRIFKRFLSEKSNPADESEAEYANSFDDDVDVPGAFFDDEMSKKRNRLEDVYPEVLSIPKIDNSPPEFLRPSSTTEKNVIITREKRNGAGGRRTSKCLDAEDYYYDDEEEDAETSEISNTRYDKRASQSIHPAVDRENVGGGQQQKFDKRHDASISPVNEEVKSSAFSGENVLENQQNSNDIKRNAKSSHKTSAKHKDNKHKKDKPKTTKKPQKKPKDKSKSKHKSKSNNSKSKKDKRTPPVQSKSKVKENKSHADKNHSEEEIDASVNRRNTNSIADSSLNNSEQDDNECSDDAQDDEKRYKRKNSIVIKAIPYGKTIKEFQILQKPEDLKKDAGKKVESSLKSKTREDKLQSSDADHVNSFGEMKNLLGRLITKVDNLHDLVSAMRDKRDDRYQDSNSVENRTDD